MRYLKHCTKKPTISLWFQVCLNLARLPTDPGFSFSKGGTPQQRSSLPDITQQPHPVLKQESEVSVPNKGSGSQVPSQEGVKPPAVCKAPLQVP